MAQMIVVRIKVAATFLSFQAPHNSKLCFACQPSFYRLVDVTNLVSFATLLLLQLYCCYFARCITTTVQRLCCYCMFLYLVHLFHIICLIFNIYLPFHFNISLIEHLRVLLDLTTLFSFSAEYVMDNKHLFYTKKALAVNEKLMKQL